MSDTLIMTSIWQLLAGEIVKHPSIHPRAIMYCKMTISRLGTIFRENPLVVWFTVFAAMFSLVFVSTNDICQSITLSAHG